MKRKTLLTLAALSFLCTTVGCNNSGGTTQVSSQTSDSSQTSSVVTSESTSSSSEDTTDYGKALMSPVVYVYRGYDQIKIRPYYTNPEAAANEVYEYDIKTSGVIDIDEDDVIWYLNEGTTVVEARSQHFTFRFLVSASATQDVGWFSMASTNKTVIGQNDIADNTVFLGDSFFDFWRAGINITKTFSDYYSDYKAYNIGIGGTTTHHWRAMSPTGLFTVENAPKNIIINLGTNNINNIKESGQQVFLNIYAMIEDYLEMFPQTNVYIFSITRCTGGFAANWTNAMNCNALVKEYCENTERATFLDVMEIYGDNYANYLTDGLHQNDAGYAVFDSLIEANVTMALKNPA